MDNRATRQQIEHDEIDLKQVVSVIVCHKFFILAITLLSMIIGFVVALNEVPKYKVSA